MRFTRWLLPLAVAVATSTVAGEPATLPVPTPQQLAWQRHEFIAFAHFGINTFTDREWGEGKEDPHLFNPTDFDARQWAAVLQEAGIKLLILTAKHHDGFCLWPSKLTEHCVRNSPWRDGRGDVVREVVDALRETESSVVTRDGGLAWHPAECDVSIRPGWFYHAGEDTKVKSLATLTDIYVKSVGRNSVLLLNIPPDRRGRIADPDVARLKEFGAFIRRLEATDFAKDAVLKASSQRGSEGAARHLTDGRLDTSWTPAEGQTSGSVEFDLGQARTFNVARIQEDISLGERVRAYHVEVQDADQWRTITEGRVIGQKQLRRFPEITARRVRLVINDAAAPPAIAELGLHLNPLGSAR